MAKHRKDIASLVPDTRSRVTNGSALFLAGVDGRSAEYRRFNPDSPDGLSI